MITKGFDRKFPFGDIKVSQEGLERTVNVKLSPWWVTGITDSEGNFSISIANDNKIHAAFKVAQKTHSINILLSLQDYFSCGTVCIDNRQFDTYKFTVSKLDDLLNIIIPHFEKYELQTSKQLDFLDFKEAVLLFRDGSRLKNKSCILSIKNRMNNQRSFDERWHYYNRILFIRPEWLQAFIDGEGSFQFTMSHTLSRNKTSLAVSATLEIAQNSHSIKLLDAIKRYLTVGYLKPKYDITSLEGAKSSRSVNRFIVSQFDIITNFVDKYPMLTRKHLDYLDWKKLISLKKQKAYLTYEGKLEMFKIKSGMNSKRSDISKSSLWGSIWLVISRILGWLGIMLFFIVLITIKIFFNVDDSLENEENEKTLPDDLICDDRKSDKDKSIDENATNGESVVLDSDPHDEPIETVIDSPVTFVEPSGDLYPGENEIIDILIHNMDAYVRNSGLQIVPTENISTDELKAIKSLLEAIEVGDLLPSSPIGSDYFEYIVRNIRSGNAVDVYSPESERSSIDSEGLTRLERMDAIIRDQEERARILSVQDMVNTDRENRELLSVLNRPGAVIIHTEPTASPLPLPMPGSNIVGPVPSRAERIERSAWLRNVAAVRYWNNTVFRLNGEAGDSTRRTLSEELDNMNPADLPLPYQEDSELAELNKNSEQSDDVSDVPLPPQDE